MLSQLFQGLRGAEARKVVRGCADGPALTGQSPRYQAAGVLQFAEPHQQIDTLFFEWVHQVIGKRQAHCQVCMLQ